MRVRLCFALSLLLALTITIITTSSVVVNAIDNNNNNNIQQQQEEQQHQQSESSTSNSNSLSTSLSNPNSNSNSNSNSNAQSNSFLASSLSSANRTASTMYNMFHTGLVLYQQAPMLERVLFVLLVLGILQLLPKGARRGLLHTGYSVCVCVYECV